MARYGRLCHICSQSARAEHGLCFLRWKVVGGPHVGAYAHRVCAVNAGTDVGAPTKAKSVPSIEIPERQAYRVGEYSYKPPRGGFRPFRLPASRAADVFMADIIRPRYRVRAWEIARAVYSEPRGAGSWGVRGGYTRLVFLDGWIQRRRGWSGKTERITVYGQNVMFYLLYEMGIRPPAGQSAPSPRSLRKQISEA